MADRPILFNAPMVRVTLSDIKTATRRAIKPQPVPCDHSYGERRSGQPIPTEFFCLDRNEWACRTCGEGVRMDRSPEGCSGIKCPYGQPGDRLWVREAWRTLDYLDEHSGSRVAELCLDAGYKRPWAPIEYIADGARANWEHTSTPPHQGKPEPGRYRHARFMPRWASRITLEVTGVRVERLQDITPAQILAEGVRIPATPEGQALIDISTRHGPAHFLTKLRSNTTDDLLRANWAALWVQINGIESWHANPWVWVVEFKRVTS